MNFRDYKQISGEDKITGRPLYCAKVDFYPYIKLHMLTNFKPPLNAEKAIVNRLNYLFLDSSFVKILKKHTVLKLIMIFRKVRKRVFK
jgi:phage/plasmid-associated DNA primase